MKAVLTFSTRYPKYHPRQGELTNFAEKIINGKKIHTCRQNYDYWAEKIARLKKAGGVLSLRTWTGKPYASPQAEFLQVPAEVVEVQRLKLSIDYYDENDIPKRFIVANVDGKDVAVEDLAKNDGLTYNDFEDWFMPLFKDEYTEVDLAIIHFTKFRY